MTYDQALSYINNYTWSTSRPGLDRTKELLKRLGDPQKSLKFVHVAGTNGKGSTCAMLGAILSEAGYKAGLYPSPYIEDFRERIEINGKMIPKNELANITEIVSKEADVMEDHPSQFELITAIGMLYYKKMGCDIVVLEVGMGGSLDSTNVIDAPEAAVITNIGLDHTEYLGDTIEKIAETKAGIIKPGSDVIVYDNVPSVMEVIEAACKKNGAVMYDTKGLTEPISHSLTGQSFIYHRYSLNDRYNSFENAYTVVSSAAKTDMELRLSLLGTHQLKNAAVVLKTIDVLIKKGFCISDEAIKKGLINVRWPARFEILSETPLFILDGGHNPQCADALSENIYKYIYKANIYDNSMTAENDMTGRSGSENTKDMRCVTFLIGMLADKDYERTLEIIRPYGVNYVCITPDSPRALKAAELVEAVKRTCRHEAHTVNICEENDIEKAIKKALLFGLPVVAFGSLYSAGDIRRTFRRLAL